VALGSDALACDEGKARANVMTAAIYYQPEAYTTTGPKLMGRNAAGESFLRGYLAYTKTPEFWVQVQDRGHATHFTETARRYNRREPVKYVDKTQIAALAKPGTLYLPGPGLGASAWQRAMHGHASWSLCGITHTTSSEAAMNALVELLTAPVQPWDALICTSTAVKDNVQRVLQAEAAYLHERFGASRMVLPQLPMIPLGIHSADFEFTAETKAAARQTLGVPADTIVVLYTGRLSFHAKAHPLAMYQALQQAVQVSGKNVVLVECGWHANEHIEKAFATAAQQACPSVRVVTLDGRKPEDRETAWASADVFCSLSDNIQETFGIVPIEAMAAGLPVVVSDWDGYKDTVRDGVDGFRVPTLMPGAGLGADLAQRHALAIDTYDMYCGHTCTFVAVDVAATARAFALLFDSRELRQKLGTAGRERAQSVYDWRVIIPQYEALWAQLAELRAAQAPTLKALAHPWPARLDPFHAFTSYPTRVLSPQTRLALVDSDVQSALLRVRSYRQLAMIDYAKAVLPSDEEIEALLQAAHTPGKAVELLAQIPTPRQGYVFRAIAWLVKMHILRVVD
jgi:starch synthase